MKISLRGAIILIALSVVFGSVVVGVAQRVGGYKEVAKDSPEVEEAAEFAVKAQGQKQEMTYKLVAIEHAESQTVAGVNYRLCLKVGYHKEDDDVDTTEFVRTVVYRNLQKEYSLTSWAQENCGEDAGQTVQNRSR
jgi:Cystatin domain